MLKINLDRIQHFLVVLKRTDLASRRHADSDVLVLGNASLYEQKYCMVMSAAFAEAVLNSVQEFGEHLRQTLHAWFNLVRRQVLRQDCLTNNGMQGSRLLKLRICKAIQKWRCTQTDLPLRKHIFRDACESI